MKVEACFRLIEPAEERREEADHGAFRLVGFAFPRPAAGRPSQDALAAWRREDALVLAVADGVGGLPGGGSAARLALACLEACLSLDRPARDAILDAFEEANTRILGSGSATTLTVVELAHGGLRTYHCGDSSALVCGQRGRVKLFLVGHGPVGYAEHAGLLDEEEALRHDERHLISNHLGAVDMRVEMGSLPRLAPRDTVLLASDGLWDNLRREEIVEAVRKGSLGQGVHRLAALVRERMAGSEGGRPSKPDDLSLLAARPRSPRRRRPAGPAPSPEPAA